jgi:serine phosphatase RsbU (regulator of sigma subunit)
MNSKIQSHSFRAAQLRSELNRVKVLLSVFAIFLALIVLRAVISLAQGYRGEAWPFAALLAAATGYEAAWLRFVRRTVSSGKEVSNTTWTASILAESLLPTIALCLQAHTTFMGPSRALTSPVALIYFVFIILSTLHLDTGLSRAAGAFSAAGYVAASIYVFIAFPEVAAGQALPVYSTCVSYAALLLVGGFAAGKVAQEIRLHVVAALREAEAQAKIAALEHDLDVARSIQQGLLPKEPPRLDGFDIAGWNKPADATGGDYFDWQQLGDGRLAVTIADVTGHGIGAALGMAVCRAYERSALVSEKDPQVLLERLSQLLYEDLPSEKFVTLATGLLNPGEANLDLISAGHGPLIFYSAAADRFQTYDSQGPPLGLLPRVRYGGAHKLRFAAGDMLVFVTDGFIEWANAQDEDFGQQRVEDAIRAHRDKPPVAIISELHAALVKFTAGTAQPDDLTAVVVKRL